MFETEKKNLVQLFCLIYESIFHLFDLKRRLCVYHELSRRNVYPSCSFLHRSHGQVHFYTFTHPNPLCCHGYQSLPAHQTSTSSIRHFAQAKEI